MLRIKQKSSLSSSQDQQYVPLKQVTVDAHIHSFAADVTIKQVFRNEESTSIEAVYCFPIEEQAAIYAFVARIDDREIVAQLKEKQQAQREYSDALRQGHGAYLLEQDEKSQDNFIINIGALPAGQECHIQISYVSELDLVEHGSRIRFVLPTTIAPRYNPDQGGLTAPAGTTSKYVQKTSYVIEFRCRVEKINVASITSISHPIQIDLSQADFYLVEFAQANTHLDRDILLDIIMSENRATTIVAVEPGAVMASFTPTEEDCRQAMKNEQLNNEFIFVVDCSGSMADENKIGLAREAMLLFLKSLPLHCHFNIIRFGSDHQALFNEVTAVYNEENAQKAEQLINALNADLGGTELLGPLQWLDQHRPIENRARQIFLLTDGEISNVNEVLDLCCSMATSTRIFSFGLGHSPSRALVKGLARATNGRFVFIPPKSNVDVYVGEQLQKALQSCITNVQVKWNAAIPLSTAPNQLPPVYANDRLIVYGLAEDSTFVFDPHATVQLETKEQHQLGQARLDRVPSTSHGTIARLAAKALLLELEHAKLSPASNTTSSDDDKSTKKQRMIELSLKYHILSPYTAFVGVEKRMNGDNSEMVLREVPIQISADDQHLQTYSSISPSAASYSLNSSYHDCDMLDFADADQCYEMAEVASCVRYSPSLPVYYASSPGYCPTSPSYSPSSPIPLVDTAHGKTEEQNESWPTDDQSVVRYLINKQKFDGSWDLDPSIVEKLTEKTLANFNFPSTVNQHVLITAIIVVTLERRFPFYLTMWHGIVAKARTRLLDLLGKDVNQLQSLLDHIRQQL